MVIDDYISSIYFWALCFIHYMKGEIIRYGTNFLHRRWSGCGLLWNDNRGTPMSKTRNQRS